MATLYHWDTPAAAGTPRRLAEPFHGGTLRRVQRGGRPPLRRPRGPVGHAQRTGVSHPQRLCPRASTPRATTCSSTPCPPFTISYSPTVSPCRRCVRRRSRAPWASPTCIPRCGPQPARISDKFLAGIFDLILNRVYADPILLGRYPKVPLIARPWFRSLGKISDADLRIIHQPLDFYGLNYYYPVKVATGRGPGESPVGQHGRDAEDAVPYGRVPGIRPPRASAGRLPRTIWARCSAS